MTRRALDSVPWHYVVPPARPQDRAKPPPPPLLSLHHVGKSRFPPVDDKGRRVPRNELSRSLAAISSKPAAATRERHFIDRFHAWTITWNDTYVFPRDVGISGFPLRDWVKHRDLIDAMVQEYGKNRETREMI